MNLTALKWLGTAFGIAGAAVLAFNLPFSGWGFVLFLVSSLAWMTYLDLNLRLPELLLMRVVKMSMGVGLEARVPFLDHEFVTLIMSISSDAKLRGGGLKPLLKSAVRGLVPEEILNRPKQGFAIPMQDWFRGKLGKEMASVLRGRWGRIGERASLFSYGHWRAWRWTVPDVP